MTANSEKMVVVGKIGAPHGIEGALKIVSFTEPLEELFDYSPWFLKQKDSWVLTHPEHCEQQGKYLVAKLKGCSCREEAQLWTNAEIGIERKQLPAIPDGQYYWFDLEGLAVKTISGDALGIVDEIMETGANPVIVITGGKKRCLIPYLPHVVKKVDLETNCIIVDWDDD